MRDSGGNINKKSQRLKGLPLNPATTQYIYIYILVYLGSMESVMSAGHYKMDQKENFPKLIKAPPLLHSTMRSYFVGLMNIPFTCPSPGLR